MHQESIPVTSKVNCLGVNVHQQTFCVYIVLTQMSEIGCFSLSYWCLVYLVTIANKLCKNVTIRVEKFL